MERVFVELDLKNHPEENVETVLDKARAARAQAASDISADIRKMINNPEYSDIVFVCKDGARVHACRLFLVARSLVLHRMLLNGMVESQLSEIILQEVSSTALLPVMEFLYTGSLQEHAPQLWKTGYEIIVAARFFLLEGLELIVFDYLLLRVKEVGVDIEAAARYLSITVEFIGILGETVEHIARDLVSILKSRSLKLEHLQALTMNAFTYLLQETNTDNRQNGQLKFTSPEEFIRFKNIVLWCACKEFASNEPVSIHGIPPEIEATLKLLERPPDQQELIAGEQSELDMTTKQALASSVKAYLPWVNFCQIDPQFLVHVLEPMDIIPSSVITDALRFHALQRSCSIGAGTIGWSTSVKNHEIYKMNRDGSILKRMAPGIGFARYSLAMNRSREIYKWTIIIEEVCDSFIELGLHHDFDGGFISDDGGFVSDDGEFISNDGEYISKDAQSLSGQAGGWALRMDADGVSVNRRTFHDFYRGESSFIPVGEEKYYGLTYGKHYGHKNSRINFSFDLLANKCTFTVDYENFPLAWSEFPEGTFFPAVSLGSGSRGRVQIKVDDDKGRLRSMIIKDDSSEDNSSEDNSSEDNSSEGDSF